MLNPSSNIILLFKSSGERWKSLESNISTTYQGTQLVLLANLSLTFRLLIEERLQEEIGILLFINKRKRSSIAKVMQSDFFELIL